MSGGKVFPKIDTNQGYWQCKLNSESENLTIFNIPLVTKEHHFELIVYKRYTKREYHNYLMTLMV